MQSPKLEPTDRELNILREAEIPVGMYEPALILLRLVLARAERKNTDVSDAGADAGTG